MSFPEPSRFTVAEAAYVAGLPHKVVHREIDAGIVRPKGKAASRAVGLEDVLYFAIVRELRDELAPSGRKLLHRSVATAATKRATAVIFHGFKRPLADVRRELKVRLADVRKMRQNLESRPAIRGGEHVVKGTRIPARVVADLVRQGATPNELARDYDLTPIQIEACVLFDQLSPKRGRPAIAGRLVAEHVLPDSGAHAWRAPGGHGRRASVPMRSKSPPSTASSRPVRHPLETSRTSGAGSSR